MVGVIARFVSRITLGALAGRRPTFPRYGRSPRGLAGPGSAPRQLHDVAGQGFFIPPGRKDGPNRRRIPHRLRAL